MGQTLVVTRSAGRPRLRLSYLRPGRRLWLSSPPVPTRAWSILGMTDGLHLFEVETEGGLTHRRIDPVSGALHAAVAVRPFPSSGKVWFLSVGLAVTVLSLLLVVLLRPSNRPAVKPPAGTELVPPTGRAVALALDLLPGVLLAMLVFGCSLVEAIRPPLLASDPAQAGPFLLMLMVTALHTTVSELVWRRSLGCEHITIARATQQRRDQRSNHPEKYLGLGPQGVLMKT